MTYAISEVFKTLQGEGHCSGRSAIFVRFAGCNLWDNSDEHRIRDAERNGAECPKWCDTDFQKRLSADRGGLMTMIKSFGAADLVVFTGGEPLLQLDAELVIDCNRAGYMTCVETNGTIIAKHDVLYALRHLCVSPKRPLEFLPLIDQMIVHPAELTTELKVVMPAYNPLDYDQVRDHFTYAFVSPEAATSSRGVSLVQREAERNAAKFCMEHPGWALSLQTHKYLDLR